MDRMVGFLEKIIDFTGLRHRVLSSNIANADTPHYKAKDVSFESVLQKERIQLIRNNPRHMQVKDIEVHLDTTEREQPVWKDENNVELDMEVAKMTENALLHNAAIQILNSKLKTYRNAIKGMK